MSKIREPEEIDVITKDNVYDLISGLEPEWLGIFGVYPYKFNDMYVVEITNRHHLTEEIYVLTEEAFKIFKKEFED